MTVSESVTASPLVVIALRKLLCFLASLLPLQCTQSYLGRSLVEVQGQGR